MWHDATIPVPPPKVAQQNVNGSDDSQLSTNAQASANLGIQYVWDLNLKL